MTARALRGPFDYLRPEGAGVGSMLVVPLAGWEAVGVVAGLAEESEIDPEWLAAPRRLLGQVVPVDLVELAGWMASEYCSTPSRALSLVAPPARGRAKLAWWASANGGAEGQLLTARQRALLDDLRASGPRPAGADLPALRRLAGTRARRSR